MKLSLSRISYIFFGVCGWVLVYLFQDFDVTKGMIMKDQFVLRIIPEELRAAFVLNKTFRFILNDLFSIMVIYGLFPDKGKLKVAFIVMCFGLLVLLPLYITLTLFFQTESFSLTIFLHRLTVNPLMMLLLIPAFFYQERLKT